MKFSKIYIQKNFVPNILQDQYGRESIGIEIILNEDEDTEEDLDHAKDEARRYINQYIEQHTVISHTHKEERFVSEPVVLPDIQKEREVAVDYDVIIEEINNCKTIDELDGWNLISKGNHNTGMAFAKKAAQLLS